MSDFCFRIFTENIKVTYERTDCIYGLMEPEKTVKCEIDIETVLPFPPDYRGGLDLGQVYVIERQYGENL